MRILNALIIVLLLLLSGNAFGFACAGVTDFSQEIGFADTVHAEELSLLSEIKNGFVLEASGNKLIKFAESVPIAIQIASGQKGKIYYALSTKENFYSSEDYPEKNVFTWVDGKGTSFLDGSMKDFKTGDCADWTKPLDVLSLNLSGYAEGSFSVFTAAAVPRGSYFALLCAPSDTTISIQYFDGTEKSYNLGKGIFNEGGLSMVPLGFYSRYENSGFPGENFPESVIEKISEKKVCVFDSGEEKAVYWNLSGMLERIGQSAVEPDSVEPAEDVKPETVPEPINPEPVEPEPVEPEQKPEPVIDSDGDGISDIEDWCVDKPGKPENLGCPDLPEPVDKPIGAGSGEEKDSDGDGYPDAVDVCPGVRGTLPNGCPEEPAVPPKPPKPEPAPEENCAKQGEKWNIPDPDLPDECCSGLDKYWYGGSPSISIDDVCYNLDSDLASGWPNGICINCGNGVCEKEESVCSCFEDCEGKGKSGYASIEEFCVSETGFQFYCVDKRNEYWTEKDLEREREIYRLQGKEYFSSAISIEKFCSICESEPVDSDGDGFRDSIDECPEEFSEINAGCPVKEGTDCSRAAKCASIDCSNSGCDGAEPKCVDKKCKCECPFQPTEPSAGKKFNVVAISANWVGSDSAFEKEMRKHLDAFLERAELEACSSNFKLTVLPPSETKDCKGLENIGCLEPNSYNAAALSCARTHLYTGDIPLNSSDTILMVGTNQNLDIQVCNAYSHQLGRKICIASGCSSGVAGVHFSVNEPYLIAFETEFTATSSHETGHIAGFCEQYSMYDWSRQNDALSGGCTNFYPAKFETNASYYPTKFWFDKEYQKCSEAEPPLCPNIYHKLTTPPNFSRNNPGPYKVCSSLPYSLGNVTTCPSNDGIVLFGQDCIGREIFDSQGNQIGYDVMGPAHKLFLGLVGDLAAAGKKSGRYFDCYEKATFQLKWGCEK